MRRAHVLVLAAGALILTACGAGGEAARLDAPGTVPGVGELPPEDVAAPAAPPNTDERDDARARDDHDDHAPAALGNDDDVDDRARRAARG